MVKMRKWKRMSKLQRTAFLIGIFIGLLLIVGEFVMVYPEFFMKHSWWTRWIGLILITILLIDSQIPIAKKYFNLGRRMSQRQREKKRKLKQNEK